VATLEYLTLFVVALSMAAVVLWAISVLEVLSTSSQRFAEAGSSKLVWALVVVFFSWIGVACWYLTGARARVRGQQ
jgi:hypothetical protein